MNDLDKKYYRIAEVSEMLSLAQSALRYYEMVFPQLKPKRNAKGTRYYTPSDIELLRQIKYLVHDKGLKIEAAAQQLRVANDTVATKAKTVQRLEQMREKLECLRQALSKAPSHRLE